MPPGQNQDQGCCRLQQSMLPHLRVSVSFQAVLIERKRFKDPTSRGATCGQQPVGSIDGVANNVVTGLKGLPQRRSEVASRMGYCLVGQGESPYHQTGGTFVFTKTIAPSLRSCWTTQDSEFAVSFLPNQPTYPRDVSVSLTRNWSFNDTGSP